MATQPGIRGRARISRRRREKQRRQAMRAKRGDWGPLLQQARRDLRRSAAEIEERYAR